ncbi:MAG: Zn-dependent protease [Bacteroidetes bacterium]|jgi:archaemetzincin|nr:Zn-dependent protease [Bacteroidota bacterium]
MKKIFPLILIFLLSCSSNETKKINSLTDLLSINDKPLPPTQPGEWLSEHKEPGQTFEDYKKISPVSPAEGKNVIYLQPIGTFDSLRTNMIAYTAEYLQIFYGLKTVILKTLDNKIFPDSVRRLGAENQQQILAPFINHYLKSNMPSDAIVMMALTEKDLYPKESWNYVFGLTNIRDKVGVTSMFRYADYPVTSENYSLFLKRLIQVSSHEIGHMFSIYHCIHASCVMNGSNHLQETDSQPNRLCSQCHCKIVWNLKPDPIERLRKLKSFFEKHGLKNDEVDAATDLKILQEKKYSQ